MPRASLLLLLSLCVAFAAGCSISNSSESISKSISSPFKWSSASSDSSSPDDDGDKDDGKKDEKSKSATEYGVDVSHLAATYAQNGGEIGALRSAVSKLALERGITNWEVDPLTRESIGRGVREGGMTEDQFTSFSKELFGSDLSKQSSLRKGWGAAGQSAK